MMRHTRQGPRWWSIGLPLLGLGGLLVLEQQTPLSPGGHQVAEIAIMLLMYGGAVWWLRCNRGALVHQEYEREQKREGPYGPAPTPSRQGQRYGLGGPVLFALDTKEQSVAQWVYRHRQMAGLGTATLPSAAALYLPLLTPRGAVGVLGVRPVQQRRLQAPEQLHLLETFASQIALMLERATLAEET